MAAYIKNHEQVQKIHFWLLHQQNLSTTPTVNKITIHGSLIQKYKRVLIVINIEFHYKGIYNFRGNAPLQHQI